MSALQITIAGTQVLIDETTFQLHLKADERQACQFTVLDYAGTAVYTRGMQIVVTDPVLGRLYEGYVVDDKQDKSNVYPNPTIEHQIDSVDNVYLADKRTSNLLYTTSTQAGKIVTDMVAQVLSAEGVTIGYAQQTTTTQTDWSAGNLSNVGATANVGDGDLELTSTATTVSVSYPSQTAWASGTLSSVQVNTGGDLSLVGSTRNWNDGSVANQTLYGNGNPMQGVKNSQYYLTCSANNETRSRLDFAGTWQNGIIEADVVLSTDTAKKSITWRTTNWVSSDGSYAYAIELRPALLEIRSGTNGGGDFTTPLASHTFSPALAAGTYRVRVVVSGTSITAYLNGTQYLSVTDSTYSAAGYLALRNRNDTTQTTVTDYFDNFGVMAAETGTWTSASTSINAVTTIANSSISWNTSLSQGGTIQVQTSIDGGSSYQNCTSGGMIPGLTAGGSGTGKSVIVKITLSTTTTATMPDISSLVWSVIGSGYNTSGTRDTMPLGNDTFGRANQSGWGTAFDGQTWALTGTATAAISNDEGTLANTTGDAHEVLGSRTAGDQDALVRFSLSASTISAGIELRYTTTSNFYRFSASTTTLTLLKESAGLSTTLATASMALSTATFYRMHFRVTGDGTAAPVSLQGKVWLDGASEPAAWSISATD